jgi:O-antigen ligase
MTATTPADRTVEQAPAAIATDVPEPTRSRRRRGRGEPYSRGDRSLWLAGFLAAVTLAVTIAALLGSSHPKFAAIPVAVVCAGVLIYLALARFELFVLTCLFLRASLDAIGSDSAVTNPSSLLALAFMAASLLWLAARTRRNQSFRSELTLPLLLFTFACVLSTVTSEVRGVSLPELLRILAVVVMALVLERLATTPAAVRRILIAALGSALIPMTASVVAYGAGHPLLDKRAALADGIKRVRGTFAQANGFSRYLLFTLLMLAALWPHLNRRWRIVTGVSIGILGILMILTYTRSSWLALVAGVLLICWLQNKKLLIIPLVLGILVCLFVPSVVDRFTNLTADNGPQTALSGSGNSLAWRFSYWGQIIGLAKDNPVSGIGLKGTESLTASKQPHNDFLRAYVEMGVIGLMAYVLLLYALAKVAVAGVKRSRPGWEHGVGVGFAACYLAFVLVSLSANVMSQAAVLWYFFAFAACAAAVAKFGAVEQKQTEVNVSAGVGGRPMSFGS